MRYLVLLVKVILFLLLFAFAIKNTGQITINGWLDMQWQGPLVLALLAFFIAGVAAGLLTMWMPLSRARRELQAMRQSADQATASEQTARLVEPAEPLDAVV